MKTNNANAKSNANNTNVNTKNTKTMKANKQTATATKEKKQFVAVNEKAKEYASNRLNRLTEKHNTALQYATNKQATANIVNNIATYNRFIAVDVDNLCASYIEFIKQLKNELPKELIGLLKKYGCDTIRQQITVECVSAFVDAKGNVNTQSLVRMVCKFNRDIANIIRNIRKQQQDTNRTSK